MTQSVPETMLTLNFLIELLDYSSDEIYIVDREMKIVFVNRASERHYGLPKHEVIGEQSNELFQRGLWKPSIIPLVLEEKKEVSLRQQTAIGTELLTRAFPIEDETGELEYILITSTQLDRWKQVIDAPPEEADAEEETPPLIVHSEAMRNVLGFCRKVAPLATTVLLLGESGTGKSVLARYIHTMSDRTNEPFVSINCASLPEHLVESELFGYVKGAFTGAHEQGKEGLFDRADGGTLFLDEVGELSLSTQAKLLQVLQEKTFHPIGSLEERTVDVRIIAATNRSLGDMVKEGTFREDLYYRLNVVDITLPSLRERKKDIVPLIYSFLNEANEKLGMNKSISEACMEHLLHYDWPGNIRQLENVIERLVITSDEQIEVADLPAPIVEQVEEWSEPSAHFDERVEQFERKLIEEAYVLKKTTRGVAAHLGISQSRAARYLKKYGFTSSS